MNTTVHTTGPDQPNGDASEPTATPSLDPAKPGPEKTTRVDMNQASNENVGDTWMEAEERAVSGDKPSG